jgi:gliding motility-associated-like protein
VATFTTTTAGTYSVVITNTTTGCFSTSASGTVTVNPLPTATIAGTVTLCQNEPQPTVTFTGANGTAPYTFTYNLNNGANQTITSTGSTATISVPTSTAGTFSYNLVSVQDASSTACSQAQTGVATITVNPLPTATVSGTSQVCEGGASQTVTFTGANGTAPYTFTYNINNGPAQTITSTGNTATITVPATTPGVFNYNLVSVEDASATTCSQAQTGTATITVNALPVVFAGNDLILCDGQSVTLAGSGANIYTWDNGVTNGTAFIPPVGTTTYTVTGTTNSGCIDSDDATVTVQTGVQASFIADLISGCAPLTVNFTNTSGLSSNCTWTFSNGTVIEDCGNITMTFTEPGCVDVELTVEAGGCTSTFETTSFICVDNDPVADFQPNTFTLSEFNTEVLFTNGSIGASTYLWDFGDGTSISTEEQPIHEFIYDQSINYLVTLIVFSDNGCSDTTTYLFQNEEELIFYVPNTFTPDGDNFNQTFKPVFTSGFDPYDYTLLIYNRWGELIFESHNSDIGWDGSYGAGRINSNCQDGTYTWTIKFKRKDNDEYREVIGHINLIK